MLQYSADVAEKPSEECVKTVQLRDAEKKRRKEIERNKRQLRAAMETPEEAAARRAKRKEYLRKKKEQTPSEELTKAADRAKERRALREAMETPEEYALRRSKAAERERKRRLRLANERSQDGDKPLEGEEKTKREMELKKRRDKFRASKEKETPEQAAARRAKANARQKRRREQVETRKEESAEQAAARRARKAEYERKRRKEQSLRDKLNGIKRPKRLRKRETRKQAAARRALKAELQKKESGEHSFLQNATEEVSTEISEVKQEDIDEDINESCTWSSFGPSEGSFSITTTEGSYSITTTEGGYSITTADELPSTQHESEETIIVKNEPSEGSLSFVEGSKLSFVIQEVFEDNKDFPSLKVESDDIEYKPCVSHQGLEGKYIKADQDNSEDQILDIAVGPEYISGGENRSELNVDITPALQDIVVKEEVDL